MVNLISKTILDGKLINFINNNQHKIFNKSLFNYSKIDISKKLTDLNNDLDILCDFVYYLVHPKKLLLLIWNNIVGYSYIVCLLIVSISILAYIIGLKKSVKWIKGSILLYLLIQVFNYAFK